jgi:CRISPR-associated protein Csb1
MAEKLTLEFLNSAVDGMAAAFRCIVELQPVGGPGSKVFPPTYEGGKYATEKRRIDGQIADCVLLDSVQSQANRMELALLDAWRRKLVCMPMVVVDFGQSKAPEVGQITSLEAPHRIADAILRDSLLGDVKFRDSVLGKRLDHVGVRNALPLYELCPQALVWGMWDSTGPQGGLGAKFARAMTSEIVGIDMVTGVKTSSRIDPLQIMKSAGPVYRTANGDWSTDPKRAGTAKPAELRPSEVNHGNITPTIAEGGVTIQKAIQTTVLSLPALRRLHFPLQDASFNPEVEKAARVVLAALGLCAATLASEQGYDLRSRCQLVPTSPLGWELLDRPGEPATAYHLAGGEAITILTKAVLQATNAGLPWNEESIVLRPSEDLAKLVKKSRELASKIGEGEA